MYLVICKQSESYPEIVLVFILWFCADTYSFFYYFSPIKIDKNDIINVFLKEQTMSKLSKKNSNVRLSKRQSSLSDFFNVSSQEVSKTKKDVPNITLSNPNRSHIWGGFTKPVATV